MQVELVAPWLLILPFVPRNWRINAALMQILFQCTIIASGNFRLVILMSVAMIICSMVVLTSPLVFMMYLRAPDFSFLNWLTMVSLT